MDIQIVKKKEMWIWLAIILIAVSGFLIVQKMQRSGEEVAVSVGGKEVMRLDLNKEQSLEIEGKDGFTVLLEIHDRTAKVPRASCPDQVCVHHGSLSGTMDSIVCMPAQIVISLEEGEESPSVDGIVR